MIAQRCPHLAKMVGYKLASGELVVTCSAHDDVPCNRFQECATQMSAAVGLLNIESEIRAVFPQNSKEN